jgi:hypothetical protein
MVKEPRSSCFGSGNSSAAATQNSSFFGRDKRLDWLMRGRRGSVALAFFVACGGC